MTYTRHPPRCATTYVNVKTRHENARGRDDERGRNVRRGDGKGKGYGERIEGVRSGYILEDKRATGWKDPEDWGRYGKGGNCYKGSKEGKGGDSGCKGSGGWGTGMEILRYGSSMDHRDERNGHGNGNSSRVDSRSEWVLKGNGKEWGSKGNHSGNVH